MEVCLELRLEIEVLKEETREINTRSIKEIIYTSNEITAKMRGR